MTVLRLTRRNSLILLVCFATALLLATLGEASLAAKTANAQNSLSIVNNGQEKAVIIVAGNADAQTTKAANLLAEYVKKSTGAQFAIISEEQFDTASGLIPIFMGESALLQDSSLSDSLQELKQDGFIIRTYEDRIAIVGTTLWGTLFAANEFLERYVGVRWLMPGEIGEDVPEYSELNIPLGELVKEPVFKDRMISPIIPGQTTRFPIQTEWAERNNTRYSIFFHHQLHTYFPASKYGTTHPEFYPKRNGVPYIPPAGVTTGWQPCFSVPGTVDAAVQGVIEFLTRNPNAPSVSLGVNDSGGFCAEDFQVPGKTLSDVYFDWVNQVVEKVLQTHPDTWFGLLAYGPLEEPPTFALHERVVPFVTKDRMAWSDENTEAAGKSRAEQWAQVASNMGWYDYTYGSPYALPRVYPHLMAEYFQISAQNNVSSHYTELYPNWSEGPKAWVMAKLLWDPNQDVDQLLDEWYTRAVGESAAPDLKAYYDHWEHFWMERVQATDWFKAGQDMTYFDFKNGGYLNAVTDQEIAQSRQLLESVVSKAETAEQKARAGMLLQGFAQYEAAAYSYAKVEEPPSTDAEAINLLDRISGTIDDKLRWSEERNRLIESFQSDPVLTLPFSPVVWSGWSSQDFWGLAGYLEQNEPQGGPIRDYITEMAQEDASPNVRRFMNLLLQVSSGQAVNLAENASFEDGANGDAPPWYLWISSFGDIKREEGSSLTGNASIRFSDFERGGPAQIIPVNPGLVAFKAHYFTPPGGSGVVQLSINLMDAQKRSLTNLTSELKNAADTAGEWTSIELLENVPSTYQGTEIKYIQAIVIVNLVPKDIPLYVDDVTVYQTKLLGSSDLSYLSLGDVPHFSFNPSQTDYTVEVGSDVASVDLKARAASSQGLMMMYGSPLMSGSPLTVNLKAGVNTIPVTVIAPDGGKKTYTITIFRR